MPDAFARADWGAVLFILASAGLFFWAIWRAPR